jgi:hypothetical protein
LESSFLAGKEWNGTSAHDKTYEDDEEGFFHISG